MTILFTQSVYANNLFILFNKAKLYSPHLPLAYAQQEVAKQKLNQSLASKEARINFIAQEKMGENGFTNRSQSNYRIRNYAIQLAVPIYNKTQDENISLAHLGQDVATLQYQVSYNELLQAVTEQYFKILNLNSRLQLIQQQKLLVLEQKNLANANFKQGMVSITDLKETEAKFSSLKSQEENVHFEIYKEQDILTELIGTTEFTVVQQHINIDQLPHLSNIDQVFYNQSMLEKNQQIKISELNLKISENEIKQAKAEKYPVLNFSAKLTQNFDSQETAFTRKQDGLDYLFGLELNIPLYNAENKYKIKEQYANADKNKSELALTIQKQKAQLNIAFYNTLAAISKVKGMQNTEQASQKAWLSNKRAYEVGMRVNAEVLEAQNKYFEAKQERISAWYEAWQNYVKLKITAGTMIDQDIMNIDEIFYSTSRIQN